MVLFSFLCFSLEGEVGHILWYLGIFLALCSGVSLGSDGEPPVVSRA